MFVAVLVERSLAGRVARGGELAGRILSKAAEIAAAKKREEDERRARAAEAEQQAKAAEAETKIRALIAGMNQ